MNLHESIRQLLIEWQPGKVMHSAYDTAWVARLGEIEPVISNAALNWICDHQLPDGSWGATEPFYYHDRVISTLAAMTALCRRGRRASDRRQIELGLQALERMTSGATNGLMADPNGATVGFETIVPTLVAEAEALGIIKRQGDRILGRLRKQREAKLTRLNGRIINRYLSIAFSAEMVGQDHIHLLDVDNLREENGSVAYNASATAHFAGLVKPGDERALDYLRSNYDMNEGVPGISPFDVYERAWVLWNLTLIGPLDGELAPLCQPHLDHLKSAWRKGRGTGFATGYSVEDGDDTALVSSVLTAFNQEPDLEALYHYEEADHFRCYALEVNPSTSANVHMLDAFRRMGMDRDHPAVQKALHFLHENQINDTYWFDKWHTSPFYICSHAVIAASKFDTEMSRDIIRWILSTQNLDGSWGYYSPTAEESAYALQALIWWDRYGDRVPPDPIRRGADWLEAHMDPPYSALWISKSLYYSEWVVRAEILSALALAEQFGR